MASCVPFVFAKGIIGIDCPFGKTKGTQLAMSVQEFTLLLSTIFLCKYTKVMWLCKGKGFHNSFLRVKVPVMPGYPVTLDMIMGRYR